MKIFKKDFEGRSVFKVCGITFFRDRNGIYQLTAARDGATCVKCAFFGTSCVPGRYCTTGTYLKKIGTASKDIFEAVSEILASERDMRTVIKFNKPSVKCPRCANTLIVDPHTVKKINNKSVMKCSCGETFEVNLVKTLSFEGVRIKNNNNDNDNDGGENE